MRFIIKKMSVTLKAHTLGELVKAKSQLIMISSDNSVATALEKIKEFNISSLPVTDAEHGKFVGMLDIMDIVMYIVYGNLFAGEELEVDARAANQKLRDVRAEEIIGAERKIQTGRWSNGLLELEGKDNLYDALDVFCSGEKRVLVEGKVCSQIDVVEFIVNHTNVHLNRVLKRRLGDTKLVKSDQQPFNYLCCVEKDAITLSALKKMLTWKADAIAVTLDSKLFSTLSASDIRKIVKFENGEVNVDFDALLMPIESFLKKFNGDHVRPPVFVTQSEFLEDAMKKVVSNRIHRLWVVDEMNETVLSCIRVEDLIREFSGLAH
jgi:CBS domain-containing protein